MQIEHSGLTFSSFFCENHNVIRIFPYVYNGKF